MMRLCNATKWNAKFMLAGEGGGADQQQKYWETSWKWFLRINYNFNKRENNWIKKLKKSIIIEYIKYSKKGEIIVFPSLTGYIEGRARAILYLSIVPTYFIFSTYFLSTYFFISPTKLRASTVGLENYPFLVQFIGLAKQIS